MARPALALNSHGSIWTRQLPADRKVFVAYCRFRGSDGVTRLVERRASSRQAAIKRLQDAVEGLKGSASSAELTPETTFAAAAELWKTKVAARRRETSQGAYQTRLNTVLPALGQLRVRECTPARIDAFLNALEQAGRSPNYRRSLRSVISQVLALAVLHGALARNPVGELGNIEGARKEPRSLTPGEVRTWFAQVDSSEMHRRRDLPDLSRFMLGTGTRLGEALAVRWCDVDLGGIPLADPSGSVTIYPLEITHTVARVKGKPMQRTPVKTDAGARTVAMPAFVVEMLRARRPVDAADDEPLFPSGGREGPTFADPSKLTKWIREAADELDWPWMTSHNWRKTFSTVLDDSSLTERAKADTVGHSEFLRNIYVGRGQTHPEVAKVIDTAFSEIGSRATPTGQPESRQVPHSRSSQNDSEEAGPDRPAAVTLAK